MVRGTNECTQGFVSNVWYDGMRAVEDRSSERQAVNSGTATTNHLITRGDCTKEPGARSSLCSYCVASGVRSASGLFWLGGILRAILWLVMEQFLCTPLTSTRGWHIIASQF